EWQHGIREERDAAPHAVTDCRRIVRHADTFEPSERSAAVRLEALLRQRLKMRHRRRQISVLALKMRRRPMKQFWCNRNKVEVGEAFGDIADVRIHTKSLLKNKESAARRPALRTNDPGSRSRPVGHVEVDPFRSNVHI